MPPQMLKKLLFYFLISPLFFYSFVAGVSVILIKYLEEDLPSPESLLDYRPPLTTKVFDVKDRLIYEFFEERREPVPLESIPPYLVKSLVAVEDKRFYRHWGISFVDLLRAFIKNLLAGRIVQGGSTLTQQLARNMFLTQERTLARKLREALLAVKLERMYSKREILEMYLNQVYFGHGAYGVEAAAQTYFGKHVNELSIAECALLAALPRIPSLYSPYYNPKRALSRRNLFLRKLYEIKEITKEEYEKAVKEPLGVVPRRIKDNPAAYFVEEVRRYLEKKYGSDLIYRQGVYVYTTVDIDIQKAANEALESHLRALEEKKNIKPRKSDFDTLEYADSTKPPPYLQGALVAIDNRTGYVLALVGGRDFKHSSFDRAMQAKRQPGSAFKVFVYTAAIDNGFTPADVEVDAPMVVYVGHRRYAPANWDHKFMGPMTLREGLALSRNLIALKLTRYLGPEVVIEYAHRMGISSPLEPVLPVGIGTEEVTPFEMAVAFATLPRMGKRLRPIMVRKIVDREGRVIEENLPEEGEEVISPQTAFLVTSMMRSVLDMPGATATGIRRRGFKRPAAGKTGTTDDYTDAWFVGFTPEITCAVWVGFDEKKTIYRGASGGSCAAPIWAEFMKKITENMPVSDFSVPEGIVVKKICTLTGQLASPYCPSTREEYFDERNAPTIECEYHRFLHIQKDTTRIKFEKLDRNHLKGI